MLESWTIQKLQIITLGSWEWEEQYFKNPNKTLLSLRIEAGELKDSLLFQVKQWWKYCPCGCDKYTSKLNINDDLRIKYYDERLAKERKELGLD